MTGKLFRNGLSLVLIIGLVVAGHKYLDLDLMLKAWRKFSWTALGGLMLLPAIYLLIKAWRFALLMRTVEEEIPYSTLLRGYAASQSASLLPGGFAMRSAILAQAGIPVERSVGPVLANSALDQFVLLVAGIFLAYWFSAIRTAAMVLSAVLVVVVVILCIKTSRDLVGVLLKKVAARFGQEKKLLEFHDACWSLLDLKLFCSTFTLSVAADLVSYAILCIVVGSLGFKVECWPLAAAFVIPTLLGRLSPLPAGAGVTEAGMVGFIASQTAMNVNEAAAATALMRIFDVVVPALYGAFIYLLAWKGKKEPIEESDVEEGAA